MHQKIDQNILRGAQILVRDAKGVLHRMVFLERIGDCVLAVLGRAYEEIESGRAPEPMFGYPAADVFVSEEGRQLGPTP